MSIQDLMMFGSRLGMIFGLCWLMYMKYIITINNWEYAHVNADSGTDEFADFSDSYTTL